MEKLRAVLTEYQDNEGHFDQADRSMDGARAMDKVWKKKKTPGDAVRDTPGGRGSTNALIFPSLNEDVSSVTLSQALADTLFADMRVYEAAYPAYERRWGQVYVVGDQHYHMSGSAYLVHAVSRAAAAYQDVANAMRVQGELDLPFFPRQLHRAVLADTAYALYHPPLVPERDSLDTYLDRLGAFPEEAIRYIAVTLVLVLEHLHSKGLVFTNLCPGSVFFDGLGYVRVFDYCIGVNPDSVRILSTEYTSPESAVDIPSTVSDEEAAAMLANDHVSDYWRLGVLLYELLTSLPPFRSDIPADDVAAGGAAAGVGAAAGTLSRDDDILAQVRAFKPDQLVFKPDTSEPLKALIRSLLTPDRSRRISSPDAMKRHPFFAGVPSWAVDDLILAPRPQWVQDSVVAAVQDNPTIPPNLTLDPAPLVIARLGVTVLSVRGLGRETIARLFCNVIFEGERQMTKVIKADADHAEWNENFLFEMVSCPSPAATSDVVFELLSKRTNDAKGAPTLVGVAAFPVADIRDAGGAEQALTVLSAEGYPVCEVLVRLVWREDEVQLDSGVLQRTCLSKSQLTFAELLENQKTVFQVLDQNFLHSVGAEDVADYDGPPGSSGGAGAGTFTSPASPSAIHGGGAMVSRASMQVTPAVAQASGMGMSTIRLKQMAGAPGLGSLGGNSVMFRNSGMGAGGPGGLGMGIQPGTFSPPMGATATVPSTPTSSSRGGFPGPGSLLRQGSMVVPSPAGAAGPLGTSAGGAASPLGGSAASPASDAQPGSLPAGNSPQFALSPVATAADPSKARSAFGRLDLNAAAGASASAGASSGSSLGRPELVGSTSNPGNPGSSEISAGLAGLRPTAGRATVATGTGAAGTGAGGAGGAGAGTGPMSPAAGMAAAAAAAAAIAAQRGSVMPSQLASTLSGSTSAHPSGGAASPKPASRGASEDAGPGGVPGLAGLSAGNGDSLRARRPTTALPQLPPTPSGGSGGGSGSSSSASGGSGPSGLSAAFSAGGRGSVSAPSPSPASSVSSIQPVAPSPSVGGGGGGGGGVAARYLSATAAANTPASSAASPSSSAQPAAPAAASVGDAETDPVNWKAAYNQQHSRWYWYNRKTKTTTWTRPTFLPDHMQVPNGGAPPST